MSYHTYPTNALAGDYGRAALGFSFVALPLAAVDLGPGVTLFLIGLAGVFGAFAFRTATRHASAIELDQDGIAVAGWRKARLDWAALEAVKLGFYATKRDGSNGWMQLALKGGGRRLTIDSRIEGFETILRAAGAAARARGLAVTPSTAANFAAYGVALEAE